MLQSVYVVNWHRGGGVTGNGEFKDELCQALLAHEPIAVQLEKFLSVNGTLDGSMYGGAEAKFRVQSLSNLTKTGGDKILVASGMLRNISVAKGLPVGYIDAYELEGALAEIWFDLEYGTGVIVVAQNFDEGRPRKLVGFPRLDLMRNEMDILDDEELKARGLPDGLVACYYLLLELGKHEL